MLARLKSCNYLCTLKVKQTFIAADGCDVCVQTLANSPDSIWLSKQILHEFLCMTAAGKFKRVRNPRNGPSVKVYDICAICGDLIFWLNVNFIILLLTVNKDLRLQSAAERFYLLHDKRLSVASRTKLWRPVATFYQLIKLSLRQKPGFKSFPHPTIRR